MVLDMFHPIHSKKVENFGKKNQKIVDSVYPKLSSWARHMIFHCYRHSGCIAQTWHMEKNTGLNECYKF